MVKTRKIGLNLKKFIRSRRNILNHKLEKIALETDNIIHYVDKLINNVNNKIKYREVDSINAFISLEKNNLELQFITLREELNKLENQNIRCCTKDGMTLSDLQEYINKIYKVIIGKLDEFENELSNFALKNNIPYVRPRSSSDMSNKQKIQKLLFNWEIFLKKNTKELQSKLNNYFKKINLKKTVSYHSKIIRKILQLTFQKLEKEKNRLENIILVPKIVKVMETQINIVKENISDNITDITKSLCDYNINILKMHANHKISRLRNLEYKTKQKCVRGDYNCVKTIETRHKRGLCKLSKDLEKKIDLIKENPICVKVT